VFGSAPSAPGADAWSSSGPRGVGVDPNRSLATQCLTQLPSNSFIYEIACTLLAFRFAQMNPPKHDIIRPTT
jgi:hypothetical protein